MFVEFMQVEMAGESPVKGGKGDREKMTSLASQSFENQELREFKKLKTPLF